jgi:3-methyl-2-oxobutanoate hydroxymethyltransferase
MNTSSVRVPDLQQKKARGEKIAMLTAYDATMARLLDRAGVDALLVGDSLGMVVLGYETTLPVTSTTFATRGNTRGSSARWSADMPFDLPGQRGEASATQGDCCGGAAAVKSRADVQSSTWFAV